MNKIKLLNKESKIKLLSAASEGNLDFVSQIIRENKSVNCFDENGRTPIILAIINNHIKIVTALLKYPNTKLNFADKDGNTALIYSVINKSKEIVQLLLLSNCYVNMENNKGKSAFDYADELEENDIYNMLVDYTEELETPTYMVNIPPKRRKVEPIILSEEEKEIYQGITFNNIDMVKSALKKKVDVNINKGLYNMTPLMLASENGNLEIIKLLVDAGADLNKQDCVGWNAYLCADANGHNHITKYYDSLQN